MRRLAPVVVGVWMLLVMVLWWHWVDMAREGVTSFVCWGFGTSYGSQEVFEERVHWLDFWKWVPLAPVGPALLSLLVGFGYRGDPNRSSLVVGVFVAALVTVTISVGIWVGYAANLFMCYAPVWSGFVLP